jgi:2,4-dienoyl-CoA reductase-like NADH-dependent reductase (Old Yellow Enzyme family)
MEWFEVCGERYCEHLQPEQFMYSLLTRSQRISHENLRLRDKAWLEGYERWFAARAGLDRDPALPAVPPMFTPWRVRSVQLKNRVIVSPMAQYSCVDGVPGDYHLVHLGARAMGGAALVCAEMTCTSPDARITPGCPGLWNDAQGAAWQRIVEWVHAHSDAKIAMQLGHAGAKGSTRRAWDGIDLPLPDDGPEPNWPLVSASPQQYLAGISPWSRAMTRADMERVRDDFTAAARRAAQAEAWKTIVDWVHANSDARIAMQLGHAGAKGSTRRAWDGMDLPLPANGPEPNWPVVSASPQQYLAGVSQWSRAMTRADMERVRDDFVAAARRAAQAGFDWLELHCAHGYLLSSFLSPLTNRREDAYGGALENRLRYPLEVFRAVRAAWPAHLPMSVRISAHDWVPGGNTPAEAVDIARAFKAAGADLMDVSSGQVSKDEHVIFGRMFQTPFADRVRQEAGIATIAVGAISEADHVNSIIAAGRADLCAVARPHLANPAWTLMEAAKIGFTEVAWPRQYLAAKRQLESNLAREKAAAAQAPAGRS